MRIKLSPSILNADYARLGEQVRLLEAAGADYIHLDVMDGHFVPNLTFGPSVVAAIRANTSLPLDVHLMIEQPERYLVDFARAGASILTIHVEATRHPHAAIKRIHELDLRAGLAINPGSPLALAEDLVDDLELLLVMTVNPGAGGQPFIERLLSKIARARRLLDDRAARAELEVDGGVNLGNVARVAAAGANVVVAGAAVFRDGDPAANLSALRRALEGSQS